MAAPTEMHDQRRDSDRPTAVQSLRLCLRGRWEPAALDAASTQSAWSHIDWPAVCHVAQCEGLAPLLYQITRVKDLAADLPPAVDAELRRAYLGTARRNAILFNELERLLPALAAAEVPVLLLKGAALAQVIYGNIALRPMADLDLLVREKDVPTALRVFLTLGYGITPPLVYRSEVMLHRQVQAEKALVELHWSPFVPPYYQYSGLIDWVWDTALPVAGDLGTGSTWVLGPEAQLLHLCGHIQLHHANEEAKQLWFHDIAEVIAHYRDTIHWDETLARAEEYDLVLPMQRIVARVIKEYWCPSPAGCQLPVPARVLERLSVLRPSPGEQRLHAMLETGSLTGINRLWVDLVTLPGPKARLQFGWRNLFPPADYVRACYHIPNRLQVALYYPYRWLLVLRGLI